MLNQPEKGMAMLAEFVGCPPQAPSDAMHTLDDISTSTSHTASQVADLCTAELTLGITDAIL